MSDTWQALGPSSILDGRTGVRRTGRALLSGRCLDVKVARGTVFVAAAGGGLWRRDGQTWVEEAYGGSLAASAIGVDAGTLLLATGEMNARAPLAGAGIFIHDGAWRADSRTLGGASLAGARIARVASDGSALWLASSRGLLSSSGTTWQVAVPGVCTDLAVVGGSVLAGIHGQGLFRMAAGSAQRPTLPPAVDTTRLGRVAIAVAPSQPSTVYVALATVSGGLLALLRSNDGGASFPIALASPPVARLDENLTLAVHPTDPEQLLFGEVSLWRFRSEWQRLGEPRRHAPGLPPRQHAVDFAPRTSGGHTWLVAGDGGVFASDDEGVTWTSCNRGLPILQVESLAAHPYSAAALLVGSGGSGTLRYANHPVFRGSDDGDASAVVIDRQHPERWWAIQRARFADGADRGGVIYSPSAGRPGSWSGRSPAGAVDPEAPLAAAWGSLFLGGATLQVSEDEGRHWAIVNAGLGAGETVTAIEPSPWPGELVIGTSGGQLVRLVRDGYSHAWSVAVRGALTGAPLAVRALVLHHHGLPRGYAVLDETTPWAWQEVATAPRASVMQLTWDEATLTVTPLASPPGRPRCLALRVDSDDATNETLLLGGDAGVHRYQFGAGARRVDGGSWLFIGAGLPLTPVSALHVHPSTGLVRAGTLGRGVWEQLLDERTGEIPSLYLRSNIADTGHWPSPTKLGVPFEDPDRIARLSRDSVCFWTDAVDIKIGPRDAPPALDEVGFEALVDRNAQPGEVCRVFVQVHARRVRSPALTVELRQIRRSDDGEFYVPLSQATLIGRASLAGVDPLAPKTLAFDWTPPSTATWFGEYQIGLLAVAVPAGTSVPSPYSVRDLVLQLRSASVKDVRVAWRRHEQVDDFFPRHTPEPPGPGPRHLDHRFPYGSLRQLETLLASSSPDPPRVIALVDDYLLRVHRRDVADASGPADDFSAGAELAGWLVEAARLPRGQLHPRLEALRQICGIDFRAVSADLLLEHHYGDGVPAPNPKVAYEEGASLGLRSFTELVAGRSSSRPEFADGERRLIESSLKFYAFVSPMRAAIVRQAIRDWAVPGAHDTALARLIARAAVRTVRSKLPDHPQCEPITLPAAEMLLYLLNEAIDDTLATQLVRDHAPTALGTRLLQAVAPLYSVQSDPPALVAAIAEFKRRERASGVARRLWPPPPASSGSGDPSVDAPPLYGPGRYGTVELQVARSVYPFDLIVVPSITYELLLAPVMGDNPRLPGVDVVERARLDNAKLDWDAQLAPFVIVSGGNVYPQGGSRVDAVEMRRYLIEILRMPPDAIVCEPVARHTTTNVRNSVRFMQHHQLQTALITTLGPGYLPDDQASVLSGGGGAWAFFANWTAESLRERSDFGLVVAHIVPPELAWTHGRLRPAWDPNWPSRVVRVWRPVHSVINRTESLANRANLRDLADP